jgi:hypothetical protein
MLPAVLYEQVGDLAILVDQILLDSLPESLVLAAVAVTSRLLLLIDA